MTKRKMPGARSLHEPRFGSAIKKPRPLLEARHSCLALGRIVETRGEMVVWQCEDCARIWTARRAPVACDR